MRHLRADYDAIQPWPTKRAHYLKQKGNTVLAPTGDWADVDVGAQLSQGMALPIIPDDEPVFLLRAKDQLAPALVDLWATALFNASGPEPTDEVLHLVQRVRGWAHEMQTYAAEHYDGGKVPDTPPELLR